jgi:hypothetical protein
MDNRISYEDVLAEREKCAKIADQSVVEEGIFAWECDNHCGNRIASKIRARPTKI